jgi:hypothetical protein
MLVLSYQWKPVSIDLGSVSPLMALTADSTHLYPMPMGSWVMAPASAPLVNHADTPNAAPP